MFNSLLPEVICHACGSTIKKGEIFCKTCGRSRGINEFFQFKKFELIGISIGVIIVICLCFAVSIPVVFRLFTPTQQVAQTTPPLMFNTPVISPTNTPYIVVLQLTDTPVSVYTPRPMSTSTPSGTDFSSYSCPDKSSVKLRVGMRAIVQNYDVNVRSSPDVPQVWNANIVVMLRGDDKLTVIGGPQCAFEGTWWEVNTDNGYTGWVREFQPNKILLKQLN